MKISSRYSWLGDIVNPPKMLAEAIKLGKLDTTEYPGPKSNPEILALAKEAGVEKIYKSDEIAWCAVAMVVLALRAGKVVFFSGYDRLRAKSFLTFGIRVKTPMLGDVMVFDRPGGKHVALYIGEDSTHYHVAGGNQSNQFNVVRIDKERLDEARRPVYSVQPESVKRVFLDPEGFTSDNEA